MSFLSNILTGVSLGSIYAIIALGYTMVYGIAKMLNFAHGDVIMVGAYVCFFAMGNFNLPPAVGVVLAVVVCTVLGMVIERLAYKPLRAAPSLAVLITGLAMKMMDRPLSDIIAVTMPCFGTTDRTRNNAVILAEKLGTVLKTVDITASVRSHFRDIGQDPENHDVTY